MTVTLPDIIGLAGVSFVVGTYFLSQTGRMDVTRPLYPALNAVGALLILVSLYFTFNLASFVIELTWLLISVIGMYRSLSQKKQAPLDRR